MTHNFVFSYSYEMPFDKLFGASHERLTRGWVITGITRFATGLPLLLSEYDDNSLLGANEGYLPVDEPTRFLGALNITDPRSGNPYFNLSLFAPEQLGQLGDSSRRFFHGPGINNWDLALHKDIHLSETKTLELRGEFFNIYNHAQFGEPNGNIDSSAFGMVTSANPARIGQVAAKFVF
jgi:hypothetical protein